MNALIVAASLVLAGNHFVPNHFFHRQWPEGASVSFTCHPLPPHIGHILSFHTASGQADGWVQIDSKTPDDCYISMLPVDWPEGQHFIRVEQRNPSGALIASGTLGFWMVGNQPAPIVEAGQHPARPTITVQP